MTLFFPPAFFVPASFFSRLVPPIAVMSHFFFRLLSFFFFDLPFISFRLSLSFFFPVVLSLLLLPFFSPFFVSRLASFVSAFIVLSFLVLSFFVVPSLLLFLR